MTDKKYSTKDVVDAIRYAGQVIAKKQLLEDTLSWNDCAWEDRRPTDGEVIVYRTELRGCLSLYEANVPQEVQDLLRESGVINPDKIKELTAEDALEDQLRKT